MPARNPSGATPKAPAKASPSAKKQVASTNPPNPSPTFKLPSATTSSPTPTAKGPSAKGPSPAKSPKKGL